MLRFLTPLQKKNLSWPSLTTWPESNFYVYTGSLTRPECTAGLTWIVRQDPIFVPTTQLASVDTIFSDAASSYLDGNARAVQEIGDRTIYMKERPAKSGAAHLALAATSLAALVASMF